MTVWFSRVYAMKRRKTIKSEINRKLVLQRITLSKRQILTLDRELCIGCEICEKTCLENAVIKSLPAIIHEGKLMKKGLIDIDVDKCMFCGACATLCSLNAIKIEINGEEKIPVIEAEVYPILEKEIRVNVDKCQSTCKLACQESCPRKAIQVTMKQKVVDVKIDKQKCVFCKRCELACPKKAIHVTKPIKGSTQINTNFCPKGCKICVDICPSVAIAIDEDGKPVINEDYCIYCGACQEVCPEKVIMLKRTRILSSEIKYGAWIKTLEKLTSTKYLINELNAKSARKTLKISRQIN